MNAKEKGLLKDAGKLAKLFQAKERERAANEAAKHTPGPWIIFKGEPFIVYAKIDAIGNLQTISLGNGRDYLREADDKDGEAIANARLIAAAPDLLAALKDALIQLDEHGLRGGLAESAIAKAEGK